MKRPKYVKHKTVESIVTRFFGGAGIEGEPEEWEAVCSDGQSVNMVKALRKSGFWGFADAKKNTIHIWLGTKASRKNAIELLGHELGHFADLVIKSKKDPEDRADLFAWVAAETLRMANKVRP